MQQPPDPDQLREQVLSPEAADEDRRRAAEEEQIREQAERTATIHHDESPFGIWLRGQAHRKDRVGGLARVVCKDPFWPGGDNRAKVTEYFQTMGAREFVLGSVKAAWDEFDAKDKRERARAKNRLKQKQRKATRRAQRK